MEKGGYAPSESDGRPGGPSVVPPATINPLAETPCSPSFEVDGLAAKNPVENGPNGGNDRDPGGKAERHGLWCRAKNLVLPHIPKRLR